jgi:peptidoglycan hydrolase-like protein with peptidoglycan-binding domain
MNFNISKLAAAFLITSSLSLGSTGNSVKELQKILNSDPTTKVAMVGPGSPGQETAYFGPATKRAVINFQNKYAQDVLVPAGLLLGNGYVGPLTMKKLNTISGGSISLGINAQNTENTANNINIVNNYQVTSNEITDIYVTDNKIKALQSDISNKINAAIASQSASALNFSSYPSTFSPVMIKNISTQQGLAGSLLMLDGTGFTSSNDIYFGSKYVVRGVSVKNGVISLVIPPVPAGRYDIAAKNTSGISNTVVFVITNNNTPKVTIDTVAPAVVKYGQQITIHGSGFGSTGNEVITELEKIQNISSADGKTLTVTIAPESLRETAKLGNGQKLIPITLTIISNNGIAPKPISFTLAI